MNLIEKYKINRFRAMLGYLKKHGQELEIYSSIIEIDENGETFLNGNTWNGYLGSNDYSFSVKNTSTDKIFKVKKDEKEVTLTLRRCAGYFYRQLQTKKTLRKTLVDNNVIESVNIETEKKIFQDGIECVNSNEFSRECFIIDNGSKTSLEGEYIERTKTAIREVDGTVLINEIEKTNNKENRRTFVMYGIPIVTENIASISDEEKIEVDVKSFDEYMEGNVDALKEIEIRKVYQKDVSAV